MRPNVEFRTSRQRLECAKLASAFNVFDAAAPCITLRSEGRSLRISCSFLLFAYDAQADCQAFRTPAIGVQDDPGHITGGNSWLIATQHSSGCSACSSARLSIFAPRLNNQLTP